MTDLDTLREALRAPAAAGDPPDIAALIKRGRRLRRLRRLTAVAGAACAAAAVFGAVTGITHLTRPATAPAQHPAAPARPMPAPSRGHAPAQPLPSRAPASLGHTLTIAKRHGALPSHGIPLGRQHAAAPVAQRVTADLEPDGRTGPQHQLHPLIQPSSTTPAARPRPGEGDLRDSGSVCTP